MTNPISSSGSNQISDSRREQFQATREATLSAAADLFQESPDALKSELQSGKSLSDIAQEKGVSADDLQKSIESAVKSANPNASDTQVSQIAQKAISGHHHHHHAQPPQPAAATDPTQNQLPPDSTISIKA